MCGIGGILHADRDHPVREQDLVPIRDSLRHRGPDDEGLFLDGACGFAHTRLAIIDLSNRARQPILSASGRYLLAYNGEIYNFRELRDRLQRAGRRFQTTSDTEVILHLAEEGGVAALEELRGMFAIALFNRERRELLLMRDRLGIKPLFWARIDGGIAFASEPKALRRLVSPGAPTAEKIAEYLSFRLVTEDESMLPGIETLLPGQRLLTSGREQRIERWWRPSYGVDADPDELETLLERCVKRQLVSDVPVGTFLSGGVDSALVTGFAADTLSRVHTFTVAFREAGWDESPRARVVSDSLGAVAHDLQLSPEQYLDGLGEAIWHLDAPLNHAHSVHLLALSRFARGRITVALTGEGADELFAGYPRYRLFRIGRLLSALPGELTASLARRLYDSRPRWARLLEAAAPDVVCAAARNPAFAAVEDGAALAGLGDPGRALVSRVGILEQARLDGRGGLDALLELDRRTYIVSLLQRMDRMSMAAGLEARVPLLDEELVDFSLRLPAAEKVDFFDTKKPVRRAAEHRFGRAYVRAPKFGFGVPVGEWMRDGGPLEPLLSRVLGERRTAERGWFDVERCKRLLCEHRTGMRDRTELLWGLLNLELWARVCVDGDGPKAIRA